MPRVQMLRTERGSRDGVTVESFSAGLVYDLDESLALAFVNDLAAAEFADETLPAEPAPTTMADAAGLSEAQATAQAEALESAVLGPAAKPNRRGKMSAAPTEA